MSKSTKALFIFFILSGILACRTDAQNSLNRIGVELPISIFITEDQDLRIEDILRSNTIFEPQELIEKKTRPSETYWIRVDFKDQLLRLEQDSIWFMNHTFFDYATVYSVENNLIIEEKRGAFEEIAKRSSVLYVGGFQFNKESLIENRYLFIKAKRVNYFDRLTRWRVSYGTELKNNLRRGFYSAKDLNKIIPVYIFSGTCLVIFILTLGFYLYSRRLEFMFYSLYVLFLFFYLTQDIFQLHELFFGQFGIQSYTFFQACQIIINLFYIIFVAYYMNTKVDYPKLHVALKVIAIALIVLIVLEIFALLSSFFLFNIYLLDFERILMTVFGLVGMTYLLVRTKDNFGYFIVIGSFVYMIGALALLFLQQRIYMIVGSGLEILIFTVGLTYKIQQEFKARLKFQKESLINENKALRAQMNPHFIFNSLSSIQHLIISNKKEGAVKYLNKFSVLIRNLLESSIQGRIVLAEEILLLHKYLELESLRFNESFQYQIVVEESMNPEEFEVPALIVQPFVENAILHGLLNKQEGSKILNIRFKKKGHLIICEVEDNGIGREASRKAESHLKKSKKSRGIEVTQRRLEMINKSEEVSMEVIDKKSATGESQGTLVIINISIE